MKMTDSWLFGLSDAAVGSDHKTQFLQKGRCPPHPTRRLIQASHKAHLLFLKQEVVLGPLDTKTGFPNSTESGNLDWEFQLLSLNIQDVHLPRLEG